MQRPILCLHPLSLIAHQFESISEWTKYLSKLFVRWCGKSRQRELWWWPSRSRCSKPRLETINIFGALPEYSFCFEDLQLNIIPLTADTLLHDQLWYTKYRYCNAFPLILVLRVACSRQRNWMGRRETSSLCIVGRPWRRNQQKVGWFLSKVWASEACWEWEEWICPYFLKKSADFCLISPPQTND